MFKGIHFVLGEVWSFTNQQPEEVEWPQDPGHKQAEDVGAE